MQLQGHDDARKPPKEEPVEEAWRRRDWEERPAPVGEGDKREIPAPPPPEKDHDKGADEGAD